MERTNKANQLIFIERDTIVVNRLELAQDFVHPEKVRLQLKKSVKVNPIDLGALAYTVRQPQKNNHLAHLAYLVDESSFMASRRKLLVKLHDAIVTTSNADSSIYGEYVSQNLIIAWFDEHGHCDAFETEANARDAYSAYVAELNHQIKSVELNKINPKTANGLQRALITLLDLYWGSGSTKEIIREIPVIKFKRNESEAPDEAKVKFATKTFLHLARGFKCFVMKNKPFPYLLKMADYECFVFQSNDKACVTPYAKAEASSYHYEEGRLSTPEEYLFKKPLLVEGSEKAQKKYAERELVKSQNNLNLVNADPRNHNRLNYAALAMQSYTQLFILMTGVNPSELIKLEYDYSFTLEKDLLKNDFRSIKMRASGREVSYHLGSRRGLEIFKEYIELRNWVLDGVDCRYLFFAMERRGLYTRKYEQLKNNNIYKVYKSVRSKFFPSSFATITANKVRKYKTVVWNEIGVEQQVIADSLNHNPATNRKYYAVSSSDKQQAEFGLFFEATKAAAKIITERPDAAKRIPVKVVHENDSTSTTKIGSGTCKDFQHPSAMETDPPIAPDCNSQMGCLYCEHYVCHSDKEDIKKLYSLLYVIEAVRKMAIDFNHSDNLLLELTVRIQLVLAQMSAKSDNIKALVEEIKTDVFEHGILTLFWELKLQRYERMGVVM
jgi:hypothetical protein